MAISGYTNKNVTHQSTLEIKQRDISYRNKIYLHSEQ